MSNLSAVQIAKDTQQSMNETLVSFYTEMFNENKYFNDGLQKIEKYLKKNTFSTFNVLPDSIKKLFIDSKNDSFTHKTVKTETLNWVIEKNDDNVKSLYVKLSTLYTPTKFKSDITSTCLVNDIVKQFFSLPNNKFTTTQKDKSIELIEGHYFVVPSMNSTDLMVSLIKAKEPDFTY